MPRTHGIGAVATLALAFVASGCSNTNAVTPSGQGQAVTSVYPITVSGYIEAVGASGFHLWGKTAATIQVIPVRSDGKRFIAQGGPVVSAISADPSSLRVEPGKFYGSFVLRPVTVSEKGPCPSCRVVQPGSVSLEVTVAQGNGNSKTFVTSIAVTIAHKIVAVALNPLPNPSVGGSDAVLQYYDDNAKPSVIWDDIVRKNISSVPNVTGVAYGADGTLYVSNSGISGVTNGTVTEYPAPSLNPVPAKTLSSPNLKSAAGVAVDASGNVYVADNGYETVSRFPVKGRVVTIQPGWSAGADVNGVAVDTQGHLYVAMTDAGNYRPSGESKNVGALAVLPATFASNTTPSVSIESTASNGVNQPYGVAVGEFGALYAVNDYVSIVRGPPGPGPIYSTLARYESGITSASVRPDATASADLAWPLAVATDLVGNVYVANSTPPAASGQPATYYVLEYPGTFSSGGRAASKVDLGVGVPPAYTPYYMNIQGIAVYPASTSK